MRRLSCIKLFLWGVLLLGSGYAAGCGSGAEDRNPVLIQVDGQVIRVSDFKKAFEISKFAYSAADLKDVDYLRQIKTGVLSRMTDELILLNRAAELAVVVTDEELEKAAGEIQADYPDDTFGETLIAASVSLEFWTAALKKRLLLEKVVKVDLEDRIPVLPGDLDEFYADDKTGTSGLASGAASVISRIRRKKAQEEYRTWMNDLRSRYTITINKDIVNNILRF